VGIASSRLDVGLREAEAPLAFAPTVLHRASPAPRIEPGPPSILNEGAMLRWRHGERLDDVLEETCRRHADRVAVAIEGADVSSTPARIRWRVISCARG
jgi:hypothetical protein